MFEDLVTRREACAYFQMSAPTFNTYARHYPSFPPARGVQDRVYLFSLAELVTFFEEHAPKYAEKAKGAK